MADDGAGAAARSTRKRPRRRASGAAAAGAAEESGSEDESCLGHVVALARGLAPVGRRRVSLAEIGYPEAREVREMGREDVEGEIERVALRCVESILSGSGVSFSIPSRASSNQKYIEEIDRVVLLDKASNRDFLNVSGVRKTAITMRVLQVLHSVLQRGIHTTKRDIFYMDCKLFKGQNESDAVLDDIACMVGCTRSSLGVVASDRGVVVGCLRYYEGGDLIDCTRVGIGGKAIPPYVDHVRIADTTAKFILLVEKDAAFNRLAEDRFYRDYPCIIITAKGQPDVASRVFLRKLRTELNLPVLGLVDSDPYGACDAPIWSGWGSLCPHTHALTHAHSLSLSHTHMYTLSLSHTHTHTPSHTLYTLTHSLTHVPTGLKILSVYMSGSKAMSYDSANLTTPDIKWLGLRPSDFDKCACRQGPDRAGVTVRSLPLPFLQVRHRRGHASGHDGARQEDGQGAGEGGVHPAQPRLAQGQRAAPRLRLPHTVSLCAYLCFFSLSLSQELRQMTSSKKKAEIRACASPGPRYSLLTPPSPSSSLPRVAEALNSKDIQFLTKVYLPQKLREGDWI